mmetsp:Transcript_5410/g.19400  ORF Transcript_5410/g.19400 Transcript_5410/m.19400 type:complete len:302 (-) Transcript_5410:506-1411(-)
MRRASSFPPAKPGTTAAPSPSTTARMPPPFTSASQHARSLTNSARTSYPQARVKTAASLVSLTHTPTPPQRATTGAAEGVAFSSVCSMRTCRTQSRMPVRNMAIWSSAMSTPPCLTNVAALRGAASNADSSVSAAASTVVSSADAVRPVSSAATPPSPMAASASESRRETWTMRPIASSKLRRRGRAPRTPNIRDRPPAANTVSSWPAITTHHSARVAWTQHGSSASASTSSGSTRPIPHSSPASDGMGNDRWRDEESSAFTHDATLSRAPRHAPPSAARLSCAASAVMPPTAAKTRSAGA